MFIKIQKKKPVKSIITLSGLLICKAKANEPPQTGNFALPSFQQAGPLISLGQNILQANTTQYLLGEQNKNYYSLTTSLGYTF